VSHDEVSLVVSSSVNDDGQSTRTMTMDRPRSPSWH